MRSTKNILIILTVIFICANCDIEQQEEPGLNPQATVNGLPLNDGTNTVPVADDTDLISDIDAFLQCFEGKNGVEIIFHTTITTEEIPKEIPHSFLSIRHPDCGIEKAIGYGPSGIGVRKPNVGRIDDVPICEEIFPGGLYDDGDYLGLPILSSSVFLVDTIEEVLDLIKEFQNRFYRLCNHNCTSLVTEIYNKVRGENMVLNIDDIQSTLIVPSDPENPLSSFIIIEYHDPRKFQDFLTH